MRVRAPEACGQITISVKEKSLNSFMLKIFMTFSNIFHARARASSPNQQMAQKDNKLPGSFFMLLFHYAVESKPWPDLGQKIVQS